MFPGEINESIGVFLHQSEIDAVQRILIETGALSGQAKLHPRHPLHNVHQFEIEIFAQSCSLYLCRGPRISGILLRNYY